MDKSEATLVNLKTKHSLIHPNDFLYNLLSKIENSFSKFCGERNVFEQTLEHFFQLNNTIKFPCIDHKSNMVTNIVSTYIIMRMRQYTIVLNKHQSKTNTNKKTLKTCEIMNIF